MRCVSISHELKVSQWPDEKELYYYKPRNSDNMPLNTVSWGKNGAWLLLCQSYGFAEIVSLADEAKLLNSIQNVKNVTCAAFQNTVNRRVALGTSSGQLVIYDLKAKCIKQQCPNQQTPYFKVQFSIKDSHVIGANKEKVYVYKTNSGNQIAALSVPNSQTVTNFRCHPLKSNILGLCSEKGVVAVWDYNVDKPSACYEAHKSIVSDVLIKNETVLSIGADRRLSIFDYRGKKINHEKTFTQSPTAFDLHTDGLSLAVGFTDGQVLGFDLRSLKQTTQVLAKHTSRINQVSFDNFSPKVSTSNISVETTTESLQNQSEQVDSFSGIYCNVPVPTSDSINANCTKPRQSLPNAKNISDSFINAMSLNSPSRKMEDSISNMTTTKSNRRVQDSKTNLLSPKVEEKDEKEQKSDVEQVATDAEINVEKPSPNAYLPTIAPTHHRQSTEFWKAQSTPINSNSANIMQSPIYPLNGGPANLPATMNNAEIRMIMKEVVREEIGELREEIKNQTFEIMCSIRQHTLGLQWTLNKMAVDLETSIEQLRREILQLREQF